MNIINSKQRIEASKMLKFLKKEEAYYEKTVNEMKQELMRLQVRFFFPPILMISLTFYLYSKCLEINSHWLNI